MRNPIEHILENAAEHGKCEMETLRPQLALLLRIFDKYDELGLMCCGLRIEIIAAMAELEFLDQIGPVYPSYQHWFISVKLTDAGKMLAEHFAQGLYGD